MILIYGLLIFLALIVFGVFLLMPLIVIGGRWMDWCDKKFGGKT